NTLSGTLTLPAGASINQVQVQKGQSGGGFSAYTTSAEPVFQDRDKNYKTTEPCYQVTFTDNCGNRSALSNASCPVILTAVHDRLKREVELEWTAYQGFAGQALDYTLEILDENFLPKSSQPVSGTSTFTDNNLSNTDQLLRYRIKVQSNLGEVSYSNLEIVAQDVKIFVPSAFTPNGDGLNDVFEVKGRFQSNFTLLILNRWGQIIFESRDARKGWDGKINGTEAPVGVYAYRIQAIDEQGRKYESSGTVNLLR
ncbi:MAG TPA: gliding motility-associated C-terminal domain-containing protein, partial [Adhaeribacter sp.]|nr:gliding motility-associated C-terminal domain-containing protein [Adhaeribacter sp.]